MNVFQINDRGDPIIWPARSPNLNVLDYFVWGYVKVAVEHKRDDTQNEVRDEIIAAFQTITPDALCNATNFLESRTLLTSARKAVPCSSSSCYIRNVKTELIRPTGENHLKKKCAKLST